MQQLDEFYLHYTQTRSQNQILLTNQLTKVLTVRNLKRVQQQQPQKLITKMNPSQFLYVCFSGLPPLKDQFQDLGIPGEKMYVFPQGFEPQSNEQQSRKKVQISKLEQQILIIDHRLRQRTDKPLVFVYHSFGTTFVSTLFRFYPNYYSKKVIGLIAIGPYTIRALADNFCTLIKSYEEMSKQYILQNIDKLYQGHIQLFKSLRLPFHKNKYAYACHILAFGHGLGFREMFHYNRQWPGILKCIIYGEQDNRIDISALNQTAIYYCYKRKFQQDYGSKLKSVYLDRYKQKIDNVQQRFIYNLQKGKHSVHIQKIHIPSIKKIIAEYLQFIAKLQEK